MDAVEAEAGTADVELVTAVAAGDGGGGDDGGNS